jgi:hypothetical protein
MRENAALCIVVRDIVEITWPPPYCCAIQYLPRNLAMHSPKRSSRKGGEARRWQSRSSKFQRFNISAWGEYATIYTIPRMARNVPKHVWTCSNLHLQKPQTEWVIRSQAVEEVARVRCILLMSDKNLDQRINIQFCANTGKSASETLALLRVFYAEYTMKKLSDPRSGQPKTPRTDANVDRVRTLVRSDQRLGETNSRRIEYE